MINVGLITRMHRLQKALLINTRSVVYAVVVFYALKYSDEISTMRNSQDTSQTELSCILKYA